MIYVFFGLIVLGALSFLFLSNDPFSHYNYDIHPRIVAIILVLLVITGTYEAVSKPVLESSTFVELRSNKYNNSLNEDYVYIVTELQYVGSLPFSYSKKHKEYVFDLYPINDIYNLICSDTIYSIDDNLIIK